MGSDKFLLELNGKPQWLFMLDELSKLFDTVFISCRTDQAHHFPFQNLILDPPESIGPMGGIVNAFHTIENTDSLFIVGCDLPNFHVSIAEKLYLQNDEACDVCAAQSNLKEQAEPIVAIWNRKTLPTLSQFISRRDYALFKCMKTLEVKHVVVSDEHLKNVNRLEDL